MDNTMQVASYISGTITKTGKEDSCKK